MEEDASASDADAGHVDASVGTDGGATTGACGDAGLTCAEGADCVQGAAGWRCECGPDDVELDGACQSKCDRAGCDEHATCSIVDGQARCYCQSPYIGDGTACTFDATCSALDCDSNADCVVDDEQRVCVCRTGFADVDGVCSNVDECTQGSGTPCGPNEICDDTDGSFQCTCRTNALCPLGVSTYCSGTSEYACTLDADGCLVAGPSDPCPVADECEEATCASASGCGSRNRAARTPCSEGVCDGSGSCVACVLDGDCSAGLICNQERQCVVPRCGDGIVTLPSEQCDPMASGTSNDAWHCNPDCRSRTIYIPCSSSGTQCDSRASCQTGAHGTSACLPFSGNDLSQGGAVPSTGCPSLTGYTQKFLSNAFCVIECASVSDCPSQLQRCDENPFAAAGPYEADRYCVPP
jgi:hypothetical protein